jgi:hypothetical protein
MTKAASILMSGLALPALCAMSSPETDYIDGQLARLQTEFSVHIHYRYEANLFFPSAWLNPHLEIEAGEIEVEEVTRLLPILEQFLGAHPVSVVSTNLKHIYLLQELSFQGKAYGSTHHAMSIYLVCNSVSKRYSTGFLACRLHSEFSSILLSHHPFPSDQWKQINQNGFVYSGTGFEMVDNPSCYDSTERSCAEGFLVNFCRSSVENDFGILSSWLFVKHEELNVLSQQHVKLQHKQALAEEFYRSLSPDYRFD